MVNVRLGSSERVLGGGLLFDFWTLPEGVLVERGWICELRGAAKATPCGPPQEGVLRRYVRVRRAQAAPPRNQESSSDLCGRLLDVDLASQDSKSI